jgi:hypothetical protein
MNDTSFNEKSPDLLYSEYNKNIHNAFNNYNTTDTKDLIEQESVLHRLVKFISENFYIIFFVGASFIFGVYIGNEQFLNEPSECLLKLIGNATEGKAQLVFREGAQHLFFRE